MFGSRWTSRVPYREHYQAPLLGYEKWYGQNSRSKSYSQKSGVVARENKVEGLWGGKRALRKKSKQVGSEAQRLTFTAPAWKSKSCSDSLWASYNQVPLGKGPLSSGKALYPRVPAWHGKNGELHKAMPSPVTDSWPRNTYPRNKERWYQDGWYERKYTIETWKILCILLVLQIFNALVQSRNNTARSNARSRPSTALSTLHYHTCSHISTFNAVRFMFSIPLFVPWP